MSLIHMCPDQDSPNRLDRIQQALDEMHEGGWFVAGWSLAEVGDIIEVIPPEKNRPRHEGPVLTFRRPGE